MEYGHREAPMFSTKKTMPKSIRQNQPWMPATRDIVKRMWSSHEPHEIAEAINVFLSKWYGVPDGWNHQYWLYTMPSGGGVAHQAMRLGLIDATEFTEVKKQNRRRYQRNHYVPPKLKKAVKERDVACQLCGQTENLHIDHLFPRSLGGANDLENLWLLCKTCNGNKSINLWPRCLPALARGGRLPHLLTSLPGHAIRDLGPCPHRPGEHLYIWREGLAFFVGHHAAVASGAPSPGAIEERICIVSEFRGWPYPDIQPAGGLPARRGSRR